MGEGSEGADAWAEATAGIDDVDMPGLIPAKSSVGMNTCEIVQESKLRELQQKEIHSVSDLLGCSEDISRALLLHYSWNKAKLENEAFDDHFFEKYFDIDPRSKDVDMEAGEGMFLCAVCCDDECEADTKIMMECGHFFCDECYGGHLMSKIANGPDCVFATCPQKGCKFIVPERIYKRCLPEDQFKQYFHHFADSFVNVNKAIKWCVNPKCQRAVLNTSLV
jgi:ariadne-1